MGGQDPETVLVDDEDIHVGYRKKNIEHSRVNVKLDSNLSPYISFRLFLARQLALARYHEIHGTKRT